MKCRCVVIADDVQRSQYTHVNRCARQGSDAPSRALRVSFTGTPVEQAAVLPEGWAAGR